MDQKETLEALAVEEKKVEIEQERDEWRLCCSKSSVINSLYWSNGLLRKCFNILILSNFTRYTRRQFCVF